MRYRTKCGVQVLTELLSFRLHRAIHSYSLEVNLFSVRGKGLDDCQPLLVITGYPSTPRSRSGWIFSFHEEAARKISGKPETCLFLNRGFNENFAFSLIECFFYYVAVSCWNQWQPGKNAQSRNCPFTESEGLRGSIAGRAKSHFLLLFEQRLLLFTPARGEACRGNPNRTFRCATVAACVYHRARRQLVTSSWWTTVLRLCKQVTRSQPRALVLGRIKKDGGRKTLGASSFLASKFLFSNIAATAMFGSVQNGEV